MFPIRPALAVRRRRRGDSHRERLRPRTQRAGWAGTPLAKPSLQFPATGIACPPGSWS